MYTENLAKQDCVKVEIVEKAKGEDVTLWEDEQLDPATEKKGANKMLSCHKEDRRYGPSFERITVLDSERYKLGEEVITPGSRRLVHTLMVLRKQSKL